MVGDDDLERGDQAATDAGHEALRDDTRERRRELHADLLLPLGREHVDDAVQRGRCVVGVQRRHDEVTGLGGGQAGLHRLVVTHLTDQDHVGVLTQRRAKRARERVRVVADLALVHGRALVAVHVFDRVLDREDVALAVLVDEVDDGGLCRRLPGTGGAGHEHESLRQVGEVLHDRRESELLHRGDPVGDRPERHRHGALLVVDVRPESGLAVPGEREVDFLLPSELGGEVVGEDAEDQLRGLFRAQGGLVGQREQAAVDPDEGRGARGEVEVRAAETPHGLEVRVDRRDVDRHHGHRDISPGFRPRGRSARRSGPRLLPKASGVLTTDLSRDAFAGRAPPRGARNPALSLGPSAHFRRSEPYGLFTPQVRKRTLRGARPAGHSASIWESAPGSRAG